MHVTISMMSNESLRHKVGDELFQNRACNSLDPNIFFPEFDNVTDKRARETEINYAIKICNICPIRGECLDWALSNGQKNGIWGGVYLEEYYKKSRRY